MSRFADFAARKTRAARDARLYPLRTITDTAFLHAVDPVGSVWTRLMFDGPFYLSRRPGGSRPAVSLVFVQSRDGNTGAADPAALGGGEADAHLIYEGLSRVAADAVLAGATTVATGDVFFSVWHAELVALRTSLGLTRHPAQIVLTGRGCIDAERLLLFNVPEVPVYVLGSLRACEALASAVATRPWIKVLPLDRGNLARALDELGSAHGIRRISAIGGRTTATALIDAGLVQDLYLTTTDRTAGEADTPFYVGGTPPALEPIVRKRCTDPGAPFLFEHLSVGAAA